MSGRKSLLEVLSRYLDRFPPKKSARLVEEASEIFVIRLKTGPNIWAPNTLRASKQASTS